MNGASVNKSVLFLTNTLTRGGAEVQVARLAVHLRKRGWDAVVVSMTPPTALLEDLAAGGVPYFCLNMRRGVPDPTALFRLRNIVRRVRPSVVHSHIVHANILARVTRLISPIPVLISTAHNTNEGGRLRELAYRFTDPLADLTTNVSQASVDRYVRVKAAPANRIRFVPNGLDLEKYKQDPAIREKMRLELGLDAKFIWLAIGRFEAAKDYPTLLRAMSQLPIGPTMPSPVLLIVGQGKLRPDIEQLSHTLGLSDRVRFLGVRDDVCNLMNAADAYVMSSAWEGMPLVLQEASAVGLPIIATDVGGNREVIVAGTSGELVPPGRPDLLSAAMITMMQLCPDRRSAMGAAAREHVRSRYDIHRVVDLWESIYAELLAKRGISLRP